MTTITGSGNRFSAEVDDTLRLKTRSVSKDESIDATSRGDGFSIDTGLITLTSASTSAVIIFQNDELRNLVVTELAVGIGPSTGGTTDTAELLVTANLGSNISMSGGSGSAAIQANLIVGNPNTIASTSELGQEAAAISGGTANKNWVKTSVTSDDSVFAVFPKGTAFAVAITPPPGNTSMEVRVNLTTYLEKDEN